jgi:SAM-dependent methyltransferase
MRIEPKARNGRPGKRVVTLGTVLAAAVVAYALWWRKNPSACPYVLRFFVELPHPFITRARLRGILAPSPGERMLEVGPGTGYYALHTARWLEPDGTLAILDLQQEMLDHTTRRAHRQGIENIVASRGDAQALPYPDGSFDAAYLTVVLGEIPDQEQALRELRRVLKPGGRLVVGEVFPDFHMVPFGALKAKAEAAGLASERRIGGPLGYFASFRARRDTAKLSDERESGACDFTGRAV